MQTWREIWADRSRNRVAYLGSIHEERVRIGGMGHNMIEGEHAQLEQGVVAACCHVGQRQACQQLSHRLALCTPIDHLHTYKCEI